MSENIIIDVTDRTLTLSNTPTVASGANEITVEFSLQDDTWDGYQLKACFYRKDINWGVQAELDDGNCVYVPASCVRGVGTLYIGLYGTKESDNDYLDTMDRASTVVGYHIELGAINEEFTAAYLLSDINKLINELGDWRGTIESTIATMDQLQADGDQLSADMDQLQADMDQLQEDMTQLQADQDQLEEDLAELRTEIVTEITELASEKESDLTSLYDTLSGKLSSEYTAHSGNLSSEYSTYSGNLSSEYSDYSEKLSSEYSTHSASLTEETETDIQALVDKYTELVTLIQGFEPEAASDETMIAEADEFWEGISGYVSLSGGSSSSGSTDSDSDSDVDLSSLVASEDDILALFDNY